MKNFFYVSLLALFIAAPLAAIAGDHGDHAKVDCTKAENKDHAECKKH